MAERLLSPQEIEAQFPAAIQTQRLLIAAGAYCEVTAWVDENAIYRIAYSVAGPEDKITAWMDALDRAGYEPGVVDHVPDAFEEWGDED